MTFLHPEFFFWMLPPVTVLFYFWHTQKPFENRWLEERVLKRLRAPEVTMGLVGRNALFFAASLLLITAMAQPVMLEPHEEEKVRIVFFVQTGAASDADAQKARSLALEAMGSLVGNEMGIVAFDERLYRVSPQSDDYPILSLLVRSLPRSADRSDIARAVSAAGEIEDADLCVIVAAEPFFGETKGAVVLDGSDGISGLAGHVGHLKEARRERAHIPLFYYPLGLAMILILIALSSMSKRRSVGVAALGALLFVMQPGVSEAGMIDFALLHDAQEAYDKGEYLKSAALFGRYQQSHDTPQVRYNRANALYKAGRYAQAAYWYRHVYTSDPVLERYRRHNLAQTLRKIDEEHPGDKEAREPGKIPEKEQKSAGKPKAQGRFTTPLFRFD